MGVKDTIKKIFGTIKDNVEYECSDCDYETARKHFETEGGDLVCPRCGSNRVHIDD